MKRQKSPGVMYVGRVLFAAQGLVDELIDRAGTAERGIHRVARGPARHRDCRDDRRPTRMEELRAEVAELSSQLDALVSGAPRPQDDLAHLA